MSYSLDDRTRARDLYVEGGGSYEDVSHETDIPASVLKQWGGPKGENWEKQRKDFEADYADLRASYRKLVLKSIQDAITKPHSQNYLAAAKLVSGIKFGGGKAAHFDKAAFLVDILERQVAFLKERDPELLRGWQPHLRAFAESMKEE